MLDEGRSILADTLARTAARIGAGSDAWDQLAESRRFISTLISNVPGMVYRCRNDPKWTMEFVNEKCVEVTGYQRGDLIGNRKIDYASLIVEEDRDRVWHEVQAALAERRPFQIEYRIVDADGEERWVWEQGCGVFAGGRFEAIEGLILDVTDRVRNQRMLIQRERELFRAQKMEAIGQLAGGLAHDFNNVLTIVLGSAGLMGESLPPEGPERELLEEIRRAARHATDLTKQLLAIGKNQPVAPEVLVLNEVIERSRPLLDRLIRRDIRLEFDLDPTPWPIRADPSQMEQILLNLLINARDAIDGPGTIRIATANVLFAWPEPPTAMELDSGDYVQLTVADDGAGMDEATIDRIFEPFFTTKESGTGLGLPTTHGIVRQAGGDVMVESRPGQGATFRIFLPRYADASR